MANLARGRQVVNSSTVIDLTTIEGFNPNGKSPVLVWEVTGAPMVVNIRKAAANVTSPVSNRDIVLYVPPGGCVVLAGLEKIQFGSSYDVCVGTAEEFSRVLNPGFFA